MMKRLTEKRIAEILSRAEVCDDSVLTDYADIAAAMREILDIRKQNELLREELELRIADAKLYRVAFENADAELQERKNATSEPVAWRYRSKEKNTRSNWMFTDEEWRTKESVSFESEPLYTATRELRNTDYKPVMYWSGDDHFDYSSIDPLPFEGGIPLYTHPPLPTEWQSVPKKPTEAMSQAAFEAAGSPSDWFGFDEMYSAALAVAPQPPVNDLPGGGTGEEYLDHLLDNPK